MHRRVTRELCMSRYGNLKSPAFMRYFAVSLRKASAFVREEGWAPAVQIALHPRGCCSCGQPRAAVATRAPPVLTQILTPANCFPYNANVKRSVCYADL